VTPEPPESLQDIEYKPEADVAQLVEQPIRNLQILPRYQQLTLVGARQMRASASVFVRAAAES